jgi:hypothetical protein
MKTTRSLAAGAALLFITNAAQAQAPAPATASVQLNVTQAAVLSITTTQSAVSLPNVPGNAVTNFPAFDVTTAWNQNASAGSSVQLIGYFATGNALSSTNDNIPTSRVLGSINGGATAPFTGTVGTYGNARSFFTESLVTIPNGGRTDNMVIGLDYTGATAPTAGSYTGTLNLVLLVQ